MMHVDTLGGKNPMGMQKMFVALDDSTEAVSLFEDLKRLVFKNFNDCAIYTCQDEEESLDNIPFMQVAVFILTPSLLMMHNMFLDDVLAACFKNKISVLPLLTDKKYEKQYTRFFGTIQYLCPFDDDFTKIPFEKRLISHLSSILLSDILTEQVRSAFPVSLFLSYRQKNRAQANTLMKKIHNDHRLWNVAIWYDERIAVGESFSKEIDKAIRCADGFVLLVTNALLEMPNYVHDTEYKTAIGIRKLKGKIIAIHVTGYEGVANCDIDAFLHLYDAILRVYSDDNMEEVSKRLLEILDPPVMDNADTIYLVGLGYQNGIGVETNPSIAIELLERSAKSGCRSAAERLVDTYSNGIGVERNYDKSIFWQKKLIKTAAPKQLPEEYCKLAGLFAAKHDWKEAIKTRHMAIELLTEEDNGKKIEIFAAIICDALNENNDEGYKTALVICCQSLRLVTDMVDNGYEADTLLSLHLILSQVTRVLFLLQNSRRFQEQVKAIADKVYRMRTALLKYPELGIKECLRDSAFHEGATDTIKSFFNNAGIAERTGLKIDYDASYIYTDPAMFAEELTYINLNLQSRFMKEDFPKNYMKFVRTLLAPIDYYVKLELFDFANRNIQLAEMILDKARTAWYMENLELSLELEAQKTFLYYMMKDKGAASEWEHLWEMIEGGKEDHPELLLKGYEIVDKLLGVIASDAEAGKLLLAQEKMLSQIPGNIYDRQEVDRMQLHNNVNLYQYFYKNGDSMCFSYYAKAIELCKKLNEQENEEVFLAVQSMYLTRLRYAVPRSTEECETIDTVLDALMKNLVEYLEDNGDKIDRELGKVLCAADQYLYRLKENHPEHVFKTGGILAHYLEGRFEKYVNNIMADNPIRFLPPTLHGEFSDFELIKGMDLGFLRTFRTAFFVVHSFMIIHLLPDRHSKINAFCKVISMYKEALRSLSQGYLFQVLNNERRLLEEYREKLEHS